MACVRILGREQSAWAKTGDSQAVKSLKTVQDISNACLFYSENKKYRGIIRIMPANKISILCEIKYDVWHS